MPEKVTIMGINPQSRDKNNVNVELFTLLSVLFQQFTLTICKTSRIKSRTVSRLKGYLDNALRAS